MVDADKTVASYDEGVLSITMPATQNIKDTAIKVPIT
jgi:HSP20 family molecular chaperone IbpA